LDFYGTRAGDIPLLGVLVQEVDHALLADVLDGPVPPPPPSEGGRTFHRVLYDMARRQNMTLRDLYNLTAAARGHWVICGTPTGLPTPLKSGSSRAPPTAISNNDLAVIEEIARIAERGKFDLLFVSDGLDYEQEDLPSFMCRFEPTSLISVLSAHTTRLGLGATVSTSFTEPYNVARLFASIDHLSRGRAAWNVVTSSRPKAALNFNLDRQMDHELRNQRAEEFVDVVKGLWDCWEDGALVADKASAGSTHVLVGRAAHAPSSIFERIVLRRRDRLHEHGVVREQPRSIRCHARRDWQPCSLPAYSQWRILEIGLGELSAGVSQELFVER
jgi:hypothetical protein